MTDLKPCPFCGGECVVDPHDNDTWCMITCEDCKASSGAFSSIEDATEAWNARSPERESIALSGDGFDEAIDMMNEAYDRTMAAHSPDPDVPNSYPIAQRDAMEAAYRALRRFEQINTDVEVLTDKTRQGDGA